MITLSILLIIHLLAALIISILGQWFLVSYMERVDKSFGIFIFLIAFIIPVWGVVIDLFIIITLYRFRAQFYKDVEVFSDRINIKHIKAIKPKYGTGGAYLSLMDSPSVLRRTEALFMIGKNQFADVNKIMYKLLSDNADEIRLMAFNILEQQERFIIEDLNKVIKLSEKKDVDPIVHAKFQKNMALLYWELAYRYLIFHELEDSIMEKARHYAVTALKVLTNDATLWCLLGRIYTRTKEYDKAQRAFHKTTHLNVSPSQVLPYMAGIKYDEGDYAHVAKYLDSDALLDVVGVSGIKKFWDLS